MALQNPWLGVGPLHFSSVRNPIAAHPHQAILQWLAEWGFIATILALTIIYYGIKKGFNFIKNNPEQNLDLAVWIAFVS
jgi:O-antigen ligase